MKKHNYFIFSLLALVFWACSESISEQEFDKTTWQDDRNACKGERAKLLAQLQTIKPKLYGMNEHSILRLLGKPDQHILGLRSQKRYIYYIEAAGVCGDTSAHPQVLQVRFDALNQAKQIIFSIEP